LTVGRSDIDEQLRRLLGSSLGFACDKSENHMVQTPIVAIATNHQRRTLLGARRIGEWK
jgi:hypothetical protein